MKHLHSKELLSRMTLFSVEQILTVSGSIFLPVRLKDLNVTIVAGGGGSGWGYWYHGNAFFGGGGGGGGRVDKSFSQAEINTLKGTSQQYVIGAAGAVGASGATAPSGGNTSF